MFVKCEGNCCRRRQFDQTCRFRFDRGAPDECAGQFTTGTTPPKLVNFRSASTASVQDGDLGTLTMIWLAPRRTKRDLSRMSLPRKRPRGIPKPLTLTIRSVSWNSRAFLRHRKRPLLRSRRQPLRQPPLQHQLQPRQPQRPPSRRRNNLLVI